MTTTIMTCKSGRFVFSSKYSSEALAEHLITVRILYNTVVDLPILPEMAARIEGEIIRRSIFGTAAIEGNPLPEDRVAEIISEPDRTKTELRAEKEIRNLKVAYEFVAQQGISGSVFPISQELVKRIHSLIAFELGERGNMPGQYRNHIVKVGDREHGGVYTPPKCLADIENLMREYEKWLNSDEVLGLDPALRAALAHYHLGLIHPFGDGNGRTARLLEALVLRMSGIKYLPIMLSNFYYRNIDSYFWAFSRARKNKDYDVTPFLDFVLSGAVDSLNEIKGRITFFIRKFTLRDYYAFLRGQKKITERQHDLLILLLDYYKMFTLEDLFRIAPLNILYRPVSERTARRDLKNLCANNLVHLTEQGRYELNFRVLG